MVTLIVLAVAWSASFAAFVVSCTAKPGARARLGLWIISGSLVMMSGGIINQASRMLRWPSTAQLTIDGLSLISSLVGIGCVVVGAIKGQPARSADGTTAGHDRA